MLNKTVEYHLLEYLHIGMSITTGMWGFDAVITPKGLGKPFEKIVEFKTALQRENLKEQPNLHVGEGGVSFSKQAIKDPRFVSVAKNLSENFDWIYAYLKANNLKCIIRTEKGLDKIFE